MYEQDDLFDKSPDFTEETITEKKPIYNNAPQDFYARSKELRINSLLVAVYIGVQLILSFFAGMYVDATYSYLEEALNNVEETVAVDFSISSNPEESTKDDYPYVITIFGEFKNNYEREIPEFYIDIELFDIENKSIGIHSISRKEFLTSQTFNFSEEVLSSAEVITYTKQISAAPPTLITNGIYLLITVVIGISLVLIDKERFITDFKSFKKDYKGYITQMFIGFLMIYGVLIASSMLLSFFGITETSNNELLIQQMFDDNPYNLAILFFNLVIFTPVIEELIFRKVMFSYLEPRLKPVLTIILTGLIFAFMHIQGDYIQMIPYGGMGIVLGYVYYKSNRNIYASIGSHLLNNLFSWLVYVLTIYGLLQL